KNNRVTGENRKTDFAELLRCNANPGAFAAIALRAILLIEPCWERLELQCAADRPGFADRAQHESFKRKSPSAESGLAHSAVCVRALHDRLPGPSECGVREERHDLSSRLF